MIDHQSNIVVELGWLLLLALHEQVLPLSQIGGRRTPFNHTKLLLAFVFHFFLL